MESFKCAYTDLVDLHKIVENPKNPNKHPDRQIEMLAKIIDYQGQRCPIVISKRSGFVTKGHGRLMAIKKLGWSKAAVDYQEYEDEAQEFADMIADNKIAELAEHDDELMIEQALELKLDDGFDLDLLGVSTDIFATDLPGVVDHEGLDKLKITIRECPHCQKTFEESESKIVG